MTFDGEQLTDLKDPPGFGRREQPPNPKRKRGDKE